jgi:ribonuclease G
VVLEAHPYVVAYIKHGWPSVRMLWYKTYKKWIRLKVNANYALNSYKFYDENDDEIRLNA